MTKEYETHHLPGPPVMTTYHWAAGRDGLVRVKDRIALE